MRSKLGLHTLLGCKDQANPRKLLQTPSWLRYQRGQRFARIPAEDPDFISIVDKPPNIVRSGRRHGPGLIVLGIAAGFFCHLREC